MRIVSSYSARAGKMARSMSVYRPSDVLPSTSGGFSVPEAADTIYEQPFVSESGVLEFWSAPALELGLPLLASIYDEGFYRGIFWQGDQLAAVKAELLQLEKHWPIAVSDTATLGALRERACWLHVALDTAESCDGWVSIG